PREAARVARGRALPITIEPSAQGEAPVLRGAGWWRTTLRDLAFQVTEIARSYGRTDWPVVPQAFVFSARSASTRRRSGFVGRGALPASWRSGQGATRGVRSL